jgi:hypothetical protein
MAPLDVDPVLFTKARSAYELGRARHALLGAWPVPLAVLAALRWNSSFAWLVTLGTLLLVTVVVLRWRGQELGRAVTPGLIAGIAPLLIPALTFHCVGGCVDCCAPSGISWCQASCLGAGVLAGAFVGFRAAQFGAGRPRFLLAALAVTAATGTLGCLLGGALGVAGMVAGIAAGTLPVLLLFPRVSTH